MFDLISTLIRGTNAKAVEAATDHFAIDLITQRIREAEAGVDNAKNVLAALIVRQRHEQTTLDQVIARQKRLEDRVRQALAAGEEAMAEEGAAAVAVLENEAVVRRRTVESLDERTIRLRQSVERAYRRVADLRQSAVAARAMDMERKAQRRVNRSLNSGSAIHEAERLIRRVAEQEDPLAQSEVLDEIDHSLSHEATEDRLAQAGFGPAARTTAQDVLSRLRKND